VSNVWETYFSRYARRDAGVSGRAAAKNSFVGSGKAQRKSDGRARKNLGSGAADAAQSEGHAGVGADVGGDAEVDVLPEVPMCPPIFEGDYWVQQYMHLARLRSQKPSKSQAAVAQEQLATFRKFRDLLKTLLGREEAVYFLFPVDYVALEIPTYPEIVKRPMDLGTVKEKLHSGAYATADLLVQDVRQVFTNAALFNPPGHPVLLYAQCLQLRFEKALLLAVTELQAQYSSTGAGAGLKCSQLDLSPAGVQFALQQLCLAHGNGKPIATSAAATAAATTAIVTRSSPKAAKLGGAKLSELQDRAQSLKRPLLHTVSGDFAGTALGPPEEERKRRRGEMEAIGSGAGAGLGTGTDVEDDAEEATEGCASAAGCAPARMVLQENDHEIKQVEMQTQAVLGAGAGAAALSLTKDEVNATARSQVQRFLHPAMGYQDAMAMITELSRKMHRQHDDQFVIKLAAPGVKACFTSSVTTACASSSASASTSAPAPAPLYQAAKQGAVKRGRGRVAQCVKRVQEEPRGGLRDLPAPCRSLLSALAADTSDPDSTIASPLTDSRYTFLQMCQFRHYQFDSLRRAKHSSLMLLHHLLHPHSPSSRPLCCACQEPMRALRWHCDQCPNFDICSDCSGGTDGSYGTETAAAAGGRGVRATDTNVAAAAKSLHPHLLTPYQITFHVGDSCPGVGAGRR